MNEVVLRLPEEEALALYRQLHQHPNQDAYCETYRQLQGHFFQVLTIEEVTALLEGEE